MSPVFILGAGGHSLVCQEIAIQQNLRIEGLISTQESQNRKSPQIPLIQLDDDQFIRSTPAAQIINGIGLVSNSIGHRVAAFERYSSAKWVFPTLIHQDSICSKSVVTGHGSQIFAGAVLQPEARLGDNVVVNTGASIDHGSIIEDHAFIGPGAVICGDVRIGVGAVIGAGAVVLPGAILDSFSLVKAGTVFKGIS